jgi:predicted transcriptional regulator of viral defense system
MQVITEISLGEAKRGIFTRQEAACWADNDGARLDSLLKRAVAATEILRLRRGLFCIADRYRNEPIHPFELAQRILGPSYISLESALAYHGWIPEAVYTISSVTEKRSRLFDTPMGHFTYTRVPQTPLLAAVQREEVGDTASFFVASPIKALADYVYVNQCNWTSLTPVRDSLRVDEAELATLTVESFDALASVYRSGRVRRFLDAARKELGR